MGILGSGFWDQVSICTETNGVLTLVFYTSTFQERPPPGDGETPIDENRVAPIDATSTRIGKNSATFWLTTEIIGTEVLVFSYPEKGNGKKYATRDGADICFFIAAKGVVFRSTALFSDLDFVARKRDFLI